MLNSEQISRYSRHILLSEIGKSGQEKLSASKILVVGAGGLGSPVIQYLSAAGIGRIGIMDSDKVDLSNLQRQLLHNTLDIGKHKTESAKEKINMLNPDVEVITYPYKAETDTIVKLIPDYDLVIDCCDNFLTRFVVNDAAVLFKKPYIYGGVIEFEGQASLFFPPFGPCFRCIFIEPPVIGTGAGCQELGVFNILPGIIGLIQASEAIKWILGIGSPLIGRLLTFNSLNMNFREVIINRRSTCLACGQNQFEHSAQLPD